MEMAEEKNLAKIKATKGHGYKVEFRIYSRKGHLIKVLINAVTD